MNDEAQMSKVSCGPPARFRHLRFGFPSSFYSSVAFSHDQVQTPQHSRHVADHATRQEVREDTQVHKGRRANLQTIRYAATSAVDIKAQLALWIFRCEVNLAWRRVESLRHHNKMMD